MLFTSLLLLSAPEQSAKVKLPDPVCATPPQPWQDESRRKLASHVRYPAIAVEEGATGQVVLVMRIDRSGRIDEPSVETSSGHRALDQAALNAARAIRSFSPLPCMPGLLMQVRIPVRFNLAQEPTPAAPDASGPDTQ